MKKKHQLVELISVCCVSMCTIIMCARPSAQKKLFRLALKTLKLPINNEPKQQNKKNKIRD